MKLVYYLLCSIWIFAQVANAQIVSNNIIIETKDVGTNLNTPWEILWGPDNHIWFTERYGRVSRLDPSTGVVTPLLTIPAVADGGEAGLLGMVLHPYFVAVPHVYLVYTYVDPNPRERVVRYTYNGSTLVNEEILLENILAAGNHNGSRIVIGPDAKLYVTLGDASNTSTAQDSSVLNGKIIRMNLDGSVPDDNPISGSLIWSVGHRNPQGLVFSPAGKLYSSEHGPQNDDELNLIEKSGNYGWPAVHGFCDETSELSFCTEHNVVEPLAAWTPTLAVAGLDYYASSTYAIWEGALLMVSLKAGKMLSMDLSGDGKQITAEQVWIDDEFGRLRDICVSPEGRVFISTSNRDGRGSPAATDDRIIELFPGGKPEAVGGPKHSNAVKVFPNPADNQVFISFDNYEPGIDLKVVNALGYMIFEETDIPQNFVLPVAEFTPGAYFLQVQAENWMYKKTFVVNR